MTEYQVILGIIILTFYMRHVISIDFSYEVQ